MNGNRTVGWTARTVRSGATHLVAAAVSAASIALVAASVVFVGAAPLQLATAVLAGWVPLMALLATVEADPDRLQRFVLVFCGSLVGLALLVGALVGHPTLDAALVRLAGVEFVVAVNPVMAVLVGGAVALAYYGVFEWDGGTGERTA